MIRGMASAGGRCLNGIDESIEVVDETGNFFFNFYLFFLRNTMRGYTCVLVEQTPLCMCINDTFCPDWSTSASL